MSKSTSTLPLLLLFVLLGGCSAEGGIKLPGVYRVDIQQGNVIDQDMIDRLRPGMDKNQVEFILGTPAIVDPFHSNQWEYIFTLSEDGDRRRQRHLRIYFENERLAYIEGDVVASTRTPSDATRQSRTVDVPLRDDEGGFFTRILNAIAGDESPENRQTGENPENTDPSE